MIHLNGITVDYDDFVLSDITLDIKKEDFFVILGPTGAGKTGNRTRVSGLCPFSPPYRRAEYPLWASLRKTDRL